METSLVAKSSKGEPYTVQFALKEGLLSIRCSCQAGIRSLLCKHKVALASGDTSILFDPGQEKQLRRAEEWVRMTRLPEMLNALRGCEIEVERLRSELRKHKASIRHAMFSGLVAAPGEAGGDLR